MCVVCLCVYVCVVCVCVCVCEYWPMQNTELRINIPLSLDFLFT